MINERYKIVKKLGEGRNKVFLCTDRDFSDHEIAIKILKPNVDPLEFEFFRNEYLTLKRLSHPNIIQAFEFGTILNLDDLEGMDFGLEAGSKFFTMEFIRGGSVSNYKSLSNEKKFKSIIGQLCSALYYLHQSNYIYSDLKSDNILVQEVNKSPIIKFIDFGFAKLLTSGLKEFAGGTAEYIAPEFLKREEIDHRADLYSLGILLFKLTYGNFPFSAKTELEIFKYHLEREIYFPHKEPIKGLEKVIRKLTAKQPKDRFFSALQVMHALDIPISPYKNEWSNAKIFTDRKDALSIIKSYISDESASEVLAIRGMEGSGKSTLMEDIMFNYANSVYLSPAAISSGERLWKAFLKRIKYNKIIYKNLDDALKSEINDVLLGESNNLIDQLKTLLIKITRLGKFILLFDDFNKYDTYTLDLFSKLIPIFQVNDIKVIISEDTSFSFSSGFISNIMDISLTPFTDANIDEFIDSAFAPFVPKDRLKKIVLMHADLLPGNIESFIKDLILLGIVDFSPAGPVINISNETAEVLKKSQSEIYKLRLSKLNPKELETARILSLFDSSIDIVVLNCLLGLNEDETQRIISSLAEKNIVYPPKMNSVFQFTSEGLKRQVYAEIGEKKKYHLQAAKKLYSPDVSFNRRELARQFELAGDYNTSLKIYRLELTEAEKLSAYTYKKELLNHLLSLPINFQEKLNLRISLCDTLDKIGDHQNTLMTVEELLKENLEIEEKNNLEILKGKCLNRLGNLREGKQILERQIKYSKSEKFVQQINLLLAEAEFELQNYNSVKNICNELINKSDTLDVTKAKCHNLLGIVAVYDSGDLEEAVKEFKLSSDYYAITKDIINIAGAKLNLGNVYNMKGQFEFAKNYWELTHQLNSSIGNLDQEIKLLLNLGISLFNESQFVRAYGYYNEALKIAKNLGSKLLQLLVLFNIGEISNFIADYQNCQDVFEKFQAILKDSQGIEEDPDSLIVRGKFYFSIGDLKNLEELLDHYHNIFSSKNLGPLHKNSLEFLEILSSIISDKFDDAAKKLSKIKDAFYSYDDRVNFLTSNMLLAEVQFKTQAFDEAIHTLNDSRFLKYCEKNYFFSAERNYLLGLISEKYKRNDLLPPVEYFNNAYSLIKDEEITELTWKVLFALTSYYFSRGNIGKAKDYLPYTRSTIMHIADKIKDSKLKNTFLNRRDIKSALKKLNEFEKI